MSTTTGLRDHFAGQALAGLLAAGDKVSGIYDLQDSREFASKAYTLADAMLEARKT